MPYRIGVKPGKAASVLGLVGGGVFLLLGFTVLTRACLLEPAPFKAVATEALFIQNYGPALWPHTWSLAVDFEVGSNVADF